MVTGHNQTNFRNNLLNYCHSYSLSCHSFFSYSQFFITLHYYFCHNRLFFSRFIYFIATEKYFFALRDDEHMTSMKVAQFSRTPTLLSSNFQNSSPTWPRASNLKRKENIIQGWLLDVIRSFLQVGFCSQYQLINLVCWLSIDIYQFS